MISNFTLKLEKIEKQFYGIPVLKDINLVLNSGEIHSIVGENGAGKSTLMKIIGRVFKPDGGTIYYNNKKVSFNSTAEAQNSGIA